MDKKYKLTDEVNERGLHRIVALRDIPRYDVKKGDLGGFVESEENLSQDGDAWVGDNAQVSDNACVCGNACVFDNACVYEDAWVGDDTQVYGNALIFGKSSVWKNAQISGNAYVSGDAYVAGNARVYENACVSDATTVYGDVYVYGNACVSGYTKIFGDARVSSDKDYIVFKNWWSSKRYFTWTRSNNMWKVGCFYGTGKELIAKAEKDSELSGREYRRAVEYVESILKDEKSDKKKAIHRGFKGRFCKIS